MADITEIIEESAVQLEIVESGSGTVEIVDSNPTIIEIVEKVFETTNFEKEPEPIEESVETTDIVEEEIISQQKESNAAYKNLGEQIFFEVL